MIYILYIFVIYSTEEKKVIHWKIKVDVIYEIGEILLRYG